MNEQQREMLQALLDGAIIQLYRPTDGSENPWVNTIDEATAISWIVGKETFRRTRIKPETVNLVGVEFPAPLKVAPERGAYYWLVDTINEAVRDTWFGTERHRMWLKRGLVQATKEGAELQHKAMIKAVGGKV